eukprot:5404338-Pleurochrysis_carterae.AAC.4
MHIVCGCGVEPRAPFVQAAHQPQVPSDGRALLHGAKCALANGCVRCMKLVGRSRLCFAVPVFP